MQHLLMATDSNLAAEKLSEKLDVEFRRTSRVVNSRELVTGNSWEDADLQRALEPYLESGNIPDRTMLQIRDSLAAFSPEGFHFVLPHYLRYAIRNPDSEVADNVVYRLATVSPDDQYWNERLKLFSIKQRQLVCEVLQLICAIGTAATQLDRTKALEAWCMPAHSSPPTHAR
jgi:hypothetical protein